MECSKGWATRCASAKSKKCTCRCGGTNHNKRHKEIQENSSFNGQIFHFQGLHGCDSKCGVNIYYRGDRAIVMFTELPDNPGTSVTNYIEHLATEIYNAHFKGAPIENIKWMEHYPSDPKSYDEVTFTFNGSQFRHPKWKRIPMPFLQEA